MPAGQLEPLLRCLRKAAQANQAAATDGQLLERFAVHRDQAAFAVLVRRHGPLVLSVCRRVLGDWHAAEDAFQATFLILARKAGALAHPELLAHWLHGVACRTSVRARVDTARRRARESRAVLPQAVGPDDALVWRDLRPVLDEEIGRLPERHRAAVVLCYLEGQTNAEAARRLGCTRGTVATLLARARERLRRRLTGRGVALPAGLAALLARDAGAAAVPSVLQSSTVTAAAAFAAGPTAAGLVSARVASLAEGVRMVTMTKKLKLAAAVLLLVGLTGVGAGVAAYRATADGPARPGSAAPPTLHLVAFVDSGTVPREPPPPQVAQASFRTANFLVKAATREIAEHVARAAEQGRKEQALLWLGGELPDWREPCPVEVKVTPGEASGASTFQFDNGRGVVQQRMEMQGPLDRLLADTLPHEVTHVVLANGVGRPLHRWVDEGAAVLSESAPSRARQEQHLRKLLDSGEQFPLRRLFGMRDYPKNVMAMFTQGYSVTGYLVKRGGRAKVLAFVAQGDRDGWDRAVHVHYGCRSVEELEVGWLASVRKAPVAQKPRRDDVHAKPELPVPLPPAAAKKPRGRLPSGPAPEQALVSLDEEGRLRVWWRTAVAYTPRTTVNERGQQVTYYVQESYTVADRYSCEDVRVFDTKGREVAPKELPKLLKGETLVLVAVDGRPVDPLHLRLTRDGTLIFVLPVRPAAVAPLANRPVPIPPAVTPQR